MLGKVADFYEAEVDNAVEALSSLIEPLHHGLPRRRGRRPGDRHVPADLQAGGGGLIAGDPGHAAASAAGKREE
jgi:hypothetical protein